VRYYLRRGRPVKLRPDLDALDFRRRFVDFGTLLLLCAAVGVIAGLGAAGFHYLLALAKHLFLDGMAGFRPPGPVGEDPLFAETARPLSRLILFALPALGGLVGGIFVYLTAPEAEGHGTDAAIDAYHFRDGKIRTRVPFVKAIASAITMGTGGSAGREGPIAQIGAGLGSALAGWLGLSARQRRTIMVAGMGAGIGAIFRAPLAGALFAAEVLYRDMDLEPEVVAPAILSSIVAYSTFGAIFGWQALFETPSFRFRTPLELGPYLVLGLVVALGGRVYPQVFYGIRDWFKKLGIPPWLKPALGGLVVGAIGLFVPAALSTGFGAVQGAFRGQGTVAMFLVVALAKILTTSFTVGSGGSGGVFGPAVVIGGALGGAVGLVFHGWQPTLVPDPGAFAMVGMAGFFSAAAHVPISTVIMVSEMTGNYHLLVPTMFVCMLGFLLVRHHSIYEKQLPARASSPTHQRSIVRTLLERTTVGDILALRPGTPPEPVTERTALPVLIDRFAASGSSCLPVVTDEGHLAGAISLQVVQRTLGQRAALANLVVARDLATPAVTVEADQSLYSALAKMSRFDCKDLLVVDGQPDKPKVIAVLTSGDINAIYDEQILNPPAADAQTRPSMAALLRWLRGRPAQVVEPPASGGENDEAVRAPVTPE
jgi:chloride channel protein, CIC family